MPARPRKSFMKRGSGGITEGEYLFFSWGPFFDGEEWAKGKSEGEIQECWKAHREAIMERFMAELRKKGKSWEGRRPEFFWKDIKEGRLKTGVQEYFSPWPDREKHFRDVYETDYEFLKRLNLLQDWELEMLQDEILV